MSVMLYEMVTGVLPFVADNYNALLRAILEATPKNPLAVMAGDAELWAIIERGLSKDPNQRQQSMLELGLQFADWLSARGVTEDASGNSLQHKWLSRAHAAAGVAASERPAPLCLPLTVPPARSQFPSADSRSPFTRTIGGPSSVARPHPGRFAAVTAAALVFCGLFAWQTGLRAASSTALRSDMTFPAERLLSWAAPDAAAPGVRGTTAQHEAVPAVNTAPTSGAVIIAPSAAARVAKSSPRPVAARTGGVAASAAPLAPRRDPALDLMKPY